MGTFKNGILGGFSGTLGPAVGSSWKGINVIRSRPPRKRCRSSEEQARQMARMTLMTNSCIRLRVFQIGPITTQ